MSENYFSLGVKLRRARGKEKLIYKIQIIGDIIYEWELEAETR